MRTSLAVLTILSFSFTLMAADSSFAGTRKLNIPKSTLKGTGSEIASETMTISETGSNRITPRN
jgi:hypothetical protein